MDPYEKCPVYKTEHFLLRQVKLKDATDLLECYRNPTAAVRACWSNCSYDHWPQTKREMQAILRMWRREYRQRVYVRWSVIDKRSKAAVGTIEMCGGFGFFPDATGGELRADLAEPYETQLYLSELLQLATERFYSLFGANFIAINGGPEEGPRLRAIAAAGFAPYDWSLAVNHWPAPDAKDYYGRKLSM